MEIRIFKDYDSMSEAAAREMMEEMKNGASVLGLATGSTPLGMYKRLAEYCKNGEVTFRNASSFNLDEYVGIPVDHPESYHSFMERNLFQYVDFPAGATHIPKTDGEDMEADCRAYDEMVRKSGGIDVQILGIGSNGHIAFNEPDDKFTEETHIVSLDERTIKDNARFFESEDDVPKNAMTVGMGVIMGARKIIILANGQNKADAVYQMVHGDILPKVPASILRLHRNVILFVDEDAAQKLN